MAELARGTIADRPWGRTLSALGLRGVTAELSLTADQKTYLIAFHEGAVVAAYSPVVSDAAVRVALTGGLLSSTQVADIARRQAADPGRDDIELICDAIHLAPDQALRLRRRVTAQRAARTFSVERGEFVLDDEVTLPTVPGTELDIRTVIFLGARQNLSQARLGAELGRFGAWFRLRPEAEPELALYGFGNEATDRAVLDGLAAGASLGELETLGVDGHVVRAMLYALVSCNACDVAARAPAGKKPATTPAGAGDAPRSPTPPPSVARTATPVPTVAKPASSARAKAPHSSASSVAMPGSTQAAGASASRGADTPVTSDVGDAEDASTLRRGEVRTFDAPTVSLRGQTRDNRAAAARATAAAGSPELAEVAQLIARGLEQLDAGADHYTLLGLEQDARSDEVRKAYFGLARQLHPDRLAALGIADDERDAQRLFAQINTAFTVLSDRKRRDEYTDILRRGGEAAVRAEQAQAEELALRILDAEEAYHLGEMALRRDQLSVALEEFARAVELHPEEADYIAMHAWTTFLASADKVAIAPATRTAFERAIAQSPRAVVARFYLGRVERMLGRDQDALRLFKEVLRLQPGHAEATSELRVIEARMSTGPTKKR